MSNTRQKVLHVFKQLHRARLTVFDGDTNALTAAREKINSDFKKNKHVDNPDALEELIRLAEDVNTTLRTSVVQAEEVTPGKFELKLRETNTRLDNVPYNDCPSKENSAERRGK